MVPARVDFSAKYRALEKMCAIAVNNEVEMYLNSLLLYRVLGWFDDSGFLQEPDCLGEKTVPHPPGFGPRGFGTVSPMPIAQRVCGLVAVVLDDSKGLPDTHLLSALPFAALCGIEQCSSRATL